MGEANGILNSVFQSFTSLLYKHTEVVRLGTDKSHGVFLVADNLRTNEVQTSISIYCKHSIQGQYGDFLENLIKHADSLKAKR